MPSRVSRLLLALVVVASAGAWLRPAAAAPSEQGAASFITGLGNEVIQTIQSGVRGPAAATALGGIFRRGFDVPTIARFVLGRYWNAATPAQQQEYLTLFEQMVTQTYARRFSEYSGETFQVTGTQPVSDTDVLVRSNIVRPDGPPVAVDWRVRDQGAGFRIVDVMVEGVSMLLTQRNEFASVIQRSGGNVDALLQALRQQVATAGG